MRSTYVSVLIKHDPDLNQDLRVFQIDHSFQYSASEMFVANNVDSLDVLMRKSLHGFYARLVTCDNHIIKCLADCFLFYASPYMKRYIDSVYNFS